MSLLERFAAAVERLNDALGRALRWLALLMVFMGAYNAVARWATRFAGVSLSSNALNELQWYLFSMIFLLGAAYGFRRDVHVRVDVLFQRLGERGRAWIDLLGTVLFLLPFSILMLKVAWPTVRASWVVRETSPDPGGLPRYPIKAVILVGFFLLVLQGLAHVVRQVQVLRGAPPPIDPDAAPLHRGRA
jgi:TRAP-type mannitol/chloroaromatic compound transport system permease small subunit